MFKPLLAAKMPDGLSVEEVVEALKYPLIASPKLDGIRVIIREGEVWTRKLKLVPYQYIRNKLSTPAYANLDGEILTAEGGDARAFRKTTSGVMSKAGEPSFLYHVFDDISDLEEPFHKRLLKARKRCGGLPYLRIVEHETMRSADELLQYEKICLDLGYEGVMLRSYSGEYKFGRSTWREGILRKLVRITREEATVVGYEERMHNGNEAKRDAIGRLKRSSHKANLVGRGDLGALIVKSKKYKKEFSIGTGFDDGERARLWAKRSTLKGRVVTFEHRPYGEYDVPRFPVFIGFRKD
jgi:DNA ligase-1